MVEDRGARRDRVLELLEAASAPVSVANIAEALEIHPNTARFHLESLVELGQARRIDEVRETRGRPRATYQPVRPPPSEAENYRLLARMLAAWVAGNTLVPEEAGIAAGRALGADLAADLIRRGAVDREQATGHLVEAMAALGFEPTLRQVGQQTELSMHRCPYGALADEHREVICPAHLGIAQGFLDELGSSVEATSIEPRVTGDRCLTRLVHRDAQREEGSAS